MDTQHVVMDADGWVQIPGEEVSVLVRNLREDEFGNRYLLAPVPHDRLHSSHHWIAVQYEEILEKLGWNYPKLLAFRSSEGDVSRYVAWDENTVRDAYKNMRDGELFVMPRLPEFCIGMSDEQLLQFAAYMS